MSLDAEPSEVELPSLVTRLCPKPLLEDACRHALGNCTDAKNSGVKHCARHFLKEGHYWQVGPLLDDSSGNGTEI